MGFFDKLKNGLSKTKTSINEKINKIYIEQMNKIII